MTFLRINKPATMLHIRAMTADDVPLGMRLKEQAGWNQTEADWQRILAIQPEGCFVAELDGRPVATTCTCVFDSVGWLAMVLVDKAVRRRGIGSRLMEHSLAYLDRCGARTARLDATSLGRPLYEKLGFRTEYELARMEGIAAGGAFDANVGPVAADQLDTVCELDCRATGTNRRRLIERLYHERPDAMHVFTAEKRIVGYLAFRAGSRAVQVGPGVALSTEAGRALGDAALRRYVGQPVFIDIPIENAPAVHWAESSGLRVQRLFARMCRGEEVRDQPARLWASFGPEKG